MGIIMNSNENENIDLNSEIDAIMNSPSPLDTFGVTGPTEQLSLSEPKESEPFKEDSSVEVVEQALDEPTIKESALDLEKEPAPEMDNTSSEDVAEVEPLENNNVNFEQEMAFYESNKEMLLNKMVDLENELAEEENLKAVLDKKESLKSDDVEKMEKFINQNKDEIK